MPGRLGIVNRDQQGYQTKNQTNINHEPYHNSIYILIKRVCLTMEYMDFPRFLRPPIHSDTQPGPLAATAGRGREAAAWRAVELETHSCK